MKTENLDWYLLFASWFIVTISMLGSLFFSQVMEYAPCELCWYQRIALFPLVLILATGLFPFDKSALKYALPLAATGWVVAAYHNLLYYDVISQELSPCSQGVSCTERYITLFRIFSIPLLSLISFSLVTLLLLILFKRTQK
jgi:disulfide bond formation protein DsbB